MLKAYPDCNRIQPTVGAPTQHSQWVALHEGMETDFPAPKSLLEPLGCPRIMDQSPGLRAMSSGPRAIGQTQP